MNATSTSRPSPVLIRELTPRGRGGVSILEIEGRGALIQLSRLAPELLGKSVDSLRNATLVRLRVPCGDGGPVEEDLDEALVWQRADDCFELHLHGSPVLLERVITLLEGPQSTRATPASKGQVSSRFGMRFEQRAELLLASAPSDSAARTLLDQASGALMSALAQLAIIEPAARAERLQELVENGRVAARLIDVPRVVLAGPVNAGKSTLFNLLVGQERVVVSHEEGTTRDAVQARVRFGAYAVDLVDTAGAREATGVAAEVERDGQAQGQTEASAADVVIWLSSNGEAPDPRNFSHALLIRLSSKAEGGESAVDALRISSHRDPVGARELVEGAFRQALGLPRSPWKPGAPAPFDIPLRECVAELAALKDEASFQAALANLLLS